MTCVVGIKTNDKIFVGADSAAVTGGHINYRADEKVFINSNMIFGFSHSFRIGQKLRYTLKIPKQRIEDDYRFLCTTFIDSVYDIIDDKEEAKRLSFIFGYKGNLYTVHNDGQVEKVLDEYTAIGSGRDLALGSLYTTKAFGYQDPESRITYALNAASYYSTSVSPPFRVISI